MMLLMLSVGLSLKAPAADLQKEYLGVDMAITVENKRPESARVIVFSSDAAPQEFEADYKGMVFLSLEIGKSYSVVIESPGCTSKCLVFDTTDQRAKAGNYPCDVDLIPTEDSLEKIVEQRPVAVIRWHRLKREWVHDPSRVEKTHHVTSSAD